MSAPVVEWEPVPSHYDPEGTAYRLVNPLPEAGADAAGLTALRAALDDELARCEERHRQAGSYMRLYLDAQMDGLRWARAKAAEIAATTAEGGQL